MNANTSALRRPILWPTAVILGLGATAFLAVMSRATSPGAALLLADDGPVQITTFVILAICAAYAAFLSWRHAENRLDFGLLAMVFVLYACRELDLHRPTFLAEHFTRWKFYVSAEIPLWQKLVFGSAIIVTATTLVAFAVRVAPLFLRSITRRETWTLFGVLWFLALAAAQGSDKSSLNSTYGGQAFEEILETVAAGFGLLAVVHFPRRRSDPAHSEEALAGLMTGISSGPDRHPHHSHPDHHRPRRSRRGHHHHHDPHEAALR